MTSPRFTWEVVKTDQKDSTGRPMVEVHGFLDGRSLNPEAADAILRCEHHIAMRRYLEAVEEAQKSQSTSLARIAAALEAAMVPKVIVQPDGSIQSVSSVVVVPKDPA